jgi:transposase
MKFTEKEIIDAVKRVLEDGISIRGSAKSIGMSKATLQVYVYRAKEHGYSSLIRSHTNKHYDGEFKVHVVEYMRKNNCLLTQLQLTLT